ncbi:HYR domain-containing protein [Rathayibacter sp. VKM Ac-2801]|uniref:HYR domain-containing protein n=1 Tax=Rathayibacter sp. VKM Ac-2801 TaxID=2609255 RepID=UPI00131FD291|nr:HYR domain-containing protein [Rathayibacter sp. VKM Ac-2801]QHC69304.1 HYR domain-containing protein [Rathayibacter sp. VKM Ac-2801]
MRQSFFHSLVAAAVLVAGAGLTVVAAPAASAAPALSSPCLTSDRVVPLSDVVVPDGVGAVRAVLSGADGQGSGDQYYAPGGGAGGRAVGGSGSTLVVDVAVTPGQVLTLGRITGAPSGGAPEAGSPDLNAGGRGGDAQYLSTVGSDGCQHALAVAGGGGGGGGTNARGGDADAGSGAQGGANGGGNAAVDGAGGGGATSSRGGSGGAAGYDRFSPCADGNAGRAGAFLSGGDGAAVGEPRPKTNYECAAFNFSGGGGGAGYYFGGGGGSSFTGGGSNRRAEHHPGAGGGGSSFVDPSVTRIRQSSGSTSYAPVVGPVYDTAVSITKTPDFSTQGQEVTITATVTVPALNRPAPAGGTVEFTTGLGVTRATLDTNGKAVLTSRDLPQGWNDVRAHYLESITASEADRESWTALPALRHEVRVCAPAPAVTRQPASIDGTTNFPYTVTLGTTIPPVFGGRPTATWQASRDGGRTWADDPGRAGVRDDGTAFLETGSDTPGPVQYRATLTTCGGSVVSQPATVSVMGVRFDLSTLPQKSFGATFDVSGYAQAVSTPQRGIVFSSRTTGVCTVAGSTVSVAKPGTCTLTAELDGPTSAGYARVVTQSFSSTPQPLVVTARSFTQERGGPVPEDLCSAPFVGSDTWITPPTATVTRPITMSDGTTLYRPFPSWNTSTSFNSYVLRCSGGTVSSDYTITGYTSGTITMTAAVPRVTADSPTVVYGAAPPAISGSAPSGLPGSLTCGAYATGDTGFASPLLLSDRTPAGSYRTHCSGLTNPSGQLRYVDGTLTVSKAPVTVTASSPEVKAFGSPGSPTVTCTPSGFVGSDGFVTAPTGRVLTGSLTIDVGATTPIGAYTTRCDGGDAGGNYTVSTVPGTFSIADRTGPTVSVPKSIAADATTPSGAVVTFAPSAKDAVDGAVEATCAPASGSTFAIGDTTVTCTASDSAGNTGESRFVVTVSRLAQSIVFTSTAPTTPTALGSFTPTVRGGGSDRPVTLGATGSCRLDGGVVTFTRSGDCTVTADQEGDDSYAAAPRQTLVVAVAKAPQTIAYDWPTSFAADTTPTLTAISSSGRPVVYEASGSCSVAPGPNGTQVLIFSTSDDCGLNIDQPGDDVFAPAERIYRFVRVTAIRQAITFTSTPPARGFTDDTYRVTTTGGGSGNPVTLSIIENGNCTLADDVVTFFGDGTCTVKADQAGDRLHSAAPQARQVITVGTPEGNLSFGGGVPQGARALDTYHPIIVPGPSKGVPVLTASRDCSLAADGSVHNDRAGLCELKLVQPGDGYWPAREAYLSYSIYLIPQTITFTSTAPRSAQIGDTYTPTAVGGPGPALYFRAWDACELKDGVVVMISQGICSLAAFQNGDGAYEQAQWRPQQIEVGFQPGFVAIASAAPTDAKVGGSFTPVATGGPSSSAAAVLASGACSRDWSSGLVTFDSAGICTLTGYQYRDATYGTAYSAPQQFLVTKYEQTVTFTTSAPASARGGETYRPTATGRDGGSAVVIGATGACTLSDGEVSFAGAGTCSITADQAGDDRYADAQAVQTVAVSVDPGSVAFASSAPSIARVGDSTRVEITAGPSSAAPVLAASGACSVASSGTVTFTAEGTCTLTLDQAGDARHGAAPQAVQAFEVTKTPQKLVFTTDAPGSATAGGTYTPRAAGGLSSAPIVLSVDGACSLADGTVTFTGAGTCTVSADRAGDDRSAAAPRVSQSIAVGVAAATVSFGGGLPEDPRVGGSTTPTIVRGPSSADPVLAASGACSVDGGVVSFDSAGACTLTLDQAGDSRYGAAPQAVRTFEIGRGAQTLAFTSTAPTATAKGATYTPTVRAGGSSAAVVIATTTPTICSAAGGTVSFLAAGSCVVTADQAGDVSHDAAPQITQQMTVAAAAATGKKAQTLAFTSTMPTAPERGIAYPVTAKATSRLPVKFFASGACTLTATGAGTATVRLTGTTLCTVRATQPGDSEWRAATSTTQTLQVKAGTRADLTLVLATAPGLSATAPLAGTVTVTNTGTRDAATTTTRVIVSGKVASAPGAVQTPGTTAGTTVLTWTEPRVAPGRSIVYTVTLVDRPKSTAIDAKVSTTAADPTPSNNAVKRTIR